MDFIVLQPLTLLGDHATDHMGVHVFHCSRTAQPSRVWDCIDLTVTRLAHAMEYVLDAREWAVTEMKERRKSR